MTNLVPALLFFLVLALVRVCTTLFHELGHAIPAILMTRKKVTIYIGSYGEPKSSLHFRVGLLEVWFRYNPFSWEYGLCAPEAKEIPINQQMIYTITGPLTSFVIAATACFFTFTYDLNSAAKFTFVMFLISATLDLYSNLIPNQIPTKLHDGTLAYNDGYQLMQLFKFKKILPKYEQATKLYEAQKYEEAAIAFNGILKSGFKNSGVYQSTISCFLLAKQYVEAKEVCDEFAKQSIMDSDDFVNAAVCYSKLNYHEKALELYDESLRLNPNNTNSYNNKGYTLNLMERFEEAIILFDKAIEIDKEPAYAYNNRGFAKIKIGKEEEGLADIKHGLVLDKDNAYGYRNLGIYHMNKKEYSTALELYRKAKKLDDTTHMIDELILEATNYN